MSEEATSAVAELKEFKSDPRVVADGIVLAVLELGVIVLSALVQTVDPADVASVRTIRNALQTEYQAKLNGLA